ncbi:uncharacterized protein LOC131031085 [Cryptomeria japonica]|uniref:uncharacterized protein LOC131031085 n=1 Tax=Cryptomeria japonica TaxID=3369 RepID=UPI0025AC0E89|nr:uncharacterized protein LOC131031085 [Cryptomeria japonica]
MAVVGRRFKRLLAGREASPGGEGRRDTTGCRRAGPAGGVGARGCGPMPGGAIVPGVGGSLGAGGAAGVGGLGRWGQGTGRPVRALMPDDGDCTGVGVRRGAAWVALADWSCSTVQRRRSNLQQCRV